MPGQVGFERAARDLERVRYVDLRSRGHAPDHPGDERAVSLVRQDRLRLVRLRGGQVFQLVQGSAHPPQPRMRAALVGDHLVLVRVQGGGGLDIELVALVPEQSRVGHVDGDSRSRAPGGDGGIGLGPVVHLLRVGRRTRAPVPGDGDDVIGGGVAGTEHPVNVVERVQCRTGLRKVQDADSVDHRLDRGGACRSPRYRPDRRLGLAQDVLDSLEIPLEDENLAFGVHEPDPGPRGRDSDVDATVGVFPVAFAHGVGRPVLIELVDYVHGLVANLRLQADRPAWHGWLAWCGWLGWPDWHVWHGHEVLQQDSMWGLLPPLPRRGTHNALITQSPAMWRRARISRRSNPECRLMQ